MHIKNIIAETEIDAAATTKDFLVVQNEVSRVVNRNVKHYNLGMIIAVGYRVNLGKISAQIAKAHAENEFEKYRIIQDKLSKRL